MREPIVPKDSFWGDFFNALFMRNVHREESSVPNSEPEGEQVGTATSEGTLSPKPDTSLSEELHHGRNVKDADRPETDATNAKRPLRPVAHRDQKWRQHAVFPNIEQILEYYPHLSATQAGVIALINKTDGSASNQRLSEAGLSRTEFDRILAQVLDQFGHTTPWKVMNDVYQKHLKSRRPQTNSNLEPKRPDVASAARLNNVSDQSKLNEWLSKFSTSFGVQQRRREEFRPLTVDESNLNEAVRFLASRRPRQEAKTTPSPQAQELHRGLAHSLEEKPSSTEDSVKDVAQEVSPEAKVAAERISSEAKEAASQLAADVTQPASPSNYGDNDNSPLGVIYPPAIVRSDKPGEPDQKK